MRAAEIPCHAWGKNFFVSISKKKGVYIDCEENTFSKQRMDMARICIHTKCVEVINEIILVVINGISFSISMAEEITISMLLNINRKDDNAMSLVSTSSPVTTSDVKAFGEDIWEAFKDEDAWSNINDNRRRRETSEGDNK